MDNKLAVGLLLKSPGVVLGNEQAVELPLKSPEVVLDEKPTLLE